jgi:hypothetical protein
MLVLFLNHAILLYFGFSGILMICSSFSDHSPQLKTLITVLEDIYIPSGPKLVAGGSSSNNVVFFDFQVSTLQVTQARLKFRMYRKPDNCYQYPHFNSCINSSIKTAVVISESWRIVA